MRASRLLVAAFLVPVSSLFAYVVAVGWNHDTSIIDSNGAAIGLLVTIGAVFGVSRVAEDDNWSERAGTALGLATAYFLLTWLRYGDATLSVDEQPQTVWYGMCIAAFMPTVVIIPASKWAWAWLRGQGASESLAS